MSSGAQKVLDLKEALTKELPPAADDPAATERCRDILERLAEVPVNLEILTETLIGATVNKLKVHKELGGKAKALVKSWKKVAAKEQQSQNGDDETKETAVDNTANKEPVERRESFGNSSYDPESEWSDLPDQRKSISQKLYGILLSAKPALLKQGVNKTAVVALTAPIAADVERAIHESFRDRKAYADKARSLSFNLKKNQPLAVSLLLGQVEPTELVNFTAEQLAADEIRQQRQETAKKLIDSRRLDWDTANEDKINKQCGISGDLLEASLFTCGRCKSIKTTSTQKQTRSADEPMTVFVLCLNCGKRWKC